MAEYPSEDEMWLEEETDVRYQDSPYQRGSYLRNKADEYEDMDYNEQLRRFNDPHGLTTTDVFYVRTPKKEIIMADPTFPDGIRVYAPNDRAPDYVIADLVINVQQFEQYMRAAHVQGELRLELKRSKKGNLYLQVDDWRPKPRTYDPDERPQRTYNPKAGPPFPPSRCPSPPPPVSTRRAPEEPPGYYPGSGLGANGAEINPPDVIPGLECNDDEIDSIRF